MSSLKAEEISSKPNSWAHAILDEKKTSPSLHMDVEWNDISTVRVFNGLKMT